MGTTFSDSLHRNIATCSPYKMAAPPEKTLKNLTGKYVMNKSLSDNPEPVFQLQGVGFLIRKAIGVATVHLEVNAYEAPPNPPNESTDVIRHIDIEQSASGLTSTHEKRCLDDVFREHSDWLFGTVKGKTKWVTLDEVTDEFLKKGWVAQQIWGFQQVDGLRRYCRNVLVTKDSERI